MATVVAASPLLAQGTSNATRGQLLWFFDPRSDGGYHVGFDLGGNSVMMLSTTGSPSGALVGRVQTVDLPTFLVEHPSLKPIGRGDLNNFISAAQFEQNLNAGSSTLDQNFKTDAAGHWVGSVCIDILRVGLGDNWSSFVAAVQKDYLANKSFYDHLDPPAPSPSDPTFWRRNVDMIQFFKDTGRYGRTDANGAPIPSQSTSTSAGTDTTAIQQVVQKSNAEQSQAISNGDNTLMRDTSTDTYLQSLTSSNQSLINSGVKSASLDALHFDNVTLNGSTATVQTTETWTNTNADGSTVQTQAKNTYTLVFDGVAWRIADDQVALVSTQSTVTADCDNDGDSGEDESGEC